MGSVLAPSVTEGGHVLAMQPGTASLSLGARSRFSEGSACACLPKKMEKVDGGVTRGEGSWEEERGLYLEKTWEMPSLMVEGG